MGSGREAVFADLVTAGGKVADALQAFRQLIGPCDMLSYLVMMAPRLMQCRRVLKATGSMYLHCDPAASHYLKLLMDAVFGPANFRTEIVWKRSSAHSDAKQGRAQHGRIHDVILFYTKTDEWFWNHVFTPYDQSYVDSFYKNTETETGRRYQLDNLTGPGGEAKGNPSNEVMGVTRFWRYSKEKMAELIRRGRVVQTKPGSVPRYKRYLDEMPGLPLQDLWTDIGPISSQAAERLGYPTQKPAALLEAGYGLLIPFMFISIGMKTDLSSLLTARENALLVLATVTALVGSKVLSGWLAMRLSGFSHAKGLCAGLMTVPQLSATSAAASWPSLSSSTVS
jgi:hypothetical protein